MAGFSGSGGSGTYFQPGGAMIRGGSSGGLRTQPLRLPRAGAYATQRARAGQFYGETPTQWNDAYNTAFNQAYRAQHPLARGTAIPAAGANSGTGGGAPAPAPAPAPGSGSPWAAAAPRPGSPLDAQYYQNVNANQFRVNNQINTLGMQRGQDQIALQTALAQLAHQQPRQSLALEQRANQQGGLYSSVEGQNQGNLQYQFAGKQAGAQSTFQNQAASIASRIAELQQSVPIYNQQQYLAAVERATQAAQNDPAAGQNPTLNPADVSGEGNTEATPSAYGGTGTSGGGTAAANNSLGALARAQANAHAFRGETSAQWNKAFRDAYNSLWAQRRGRR